MAQVAKGDRQSLEPLVRRYASPLLTFIHRMAGDHHRSEELFQEVFLKVWTKRHTYDPERPFKPWLYQIALNHCRSALRGKTLKLVRPALGGGADGDDDNYVDPLARRAAPGDSPIEAIVATESAAIVETAVAALPERQRTVVVMRLWNGLSYAEIAAAVGRREGAVRSIMHHALAALRRELLPRIK
ncbi:MAG: sigma-70 family RNA polymerase sigma factor [Planctomycetota bacterium]|nr:sigma-70 family RNA polymerase sigma factor [Planctomycetota bacterium]